MDPRLIPPFRTHTTGTVSIPGSKSITNRTLAIAALCDGELSLNGALFSEDTHIMAEALRQLGFNVQQQEDTATIQVRGLSGLIPAASADIHVGNAGTAARILTAMLCLHPNGRFHFDGSPAMRKRPMQGLTDALAENGAATFDFQGQTGHFPFTMRTRGIQPGSIQVDASASSQILTALMIASPLCSGPVSLRLLGETVSHPFVSMTSEIMRQFRIEPLESTGFGHYTFPGKQSYSAPGTHYAIEPDATAASYFLALPLAAPATIRLERCSDIQLQGDIAFAEILKHIGVTMHVDNGDLCASSSRASTPRIQAHKEFDFNAVSDTFLTLAAIAPLLPFSVTIRGIAHTRHQETDRIAAMAAELRKLGQKVDETADTLTIHPDRKAMRQVSAHAPVSIQTYKDHRVAMSFGILGCHDLHGDGRPWIQILDPGCCSKTFPAFFETLERLRRSSDQTANQHEVLQQPLPN